MIDYDVIKTGSSGNCTVIDRRIAIDAGVPYKALRQYAPVLKLVLVTHLHQDHFIPSTIRKLAEERPTLRFGTPPWMVNHLVFNGVCKRNIDVYAMGMMNRYGDDLSVVALELSHDKPNCGYKLNVRGHRVLYATDTRTMAGIKAKNYDLYLLEANYNEDEIRERIRQKEESGEYVYEWRVLRNHLSERNALDWLYANMTQKSRYVLLHGHNQDFVS